MPENTATLFDLIDDRMEGSAGFLLHHVVMNTGKPDNADRIADEIADALTRYRESHVDRPLRGYPQGTKASS